MQPKRPIHATTLGGWEGVTLHLLINAHEIIISRACASHTDEIEICSLFSILMPDYVFCILFWAVIQILAL
jgi:hypothetical protein